MTQPLCAQSSVDLPPLEVPAFNLLALGSLGNGLSVPNPLTTLTLSTPAELAQVCPHTGGTPRRSAL